MVQVRLSRLMVATQQVWKKYDTHCTGEYPYTILGCALGHHYKVVQWFFQVCSVLAEVSPEVSVQITKGPSCAVWFSGESTPLPTHSQPDGSQESPLNPHHQLIRQTRFYHILHQTISI
jgi:hypothetical protein